MDLFVTCSRFLEELLVEELLEMGFDKVKASYCGVYVGDNSLEAIYKINYLSRIASRVQLPLSRFQCRDQRDLYQGSLAIEWEKYIGPGKTLAIDANVSHQKLKHSLHAAQVVKDGICDRIRSKRGPRPSVDIKNPDVQLNLYISGDRATISFDTSGTPLFKRGLRAETVIAPLQETLGAGMLRLAGYNGQSFCDPCCGSGTILLEAAMIATSTPPGFYRALWGFFHLPGFNRRAWKTMRADWDAERIPLTATLFGIDRDAGAAKENIRRSGFDIEVEENDFQQVSPRPFDLIVTNPPYGKRLRGPPIWDDLDRFIEQCGARGFMLRPEAPGTELRNGGDTVYLRETP